MRARLRRFVLCAACLVAPFAEAAWIEAESDNFVLVARLDEDDARRIVNDLEVYRRTILELAGVKGVPEVRKVRLYGVDSTSDVRDFTGHRSALGIYSPGTDFPVFLFVADLTADSVRGVSLHEYAHHVLYAHTTQYFPRWYNEGFAEYLASFELEGDVISIGAPSEFGSSLEYPGWPDIARVLNAITTMPERTGGPRLELFRSQLFYGISWLSVHYLQNTPELNAGFGDYITMLNDGVDPTEAFEKGFGISQDEFEDRIRDYWRRDRFPVIQFRMTDDFGASTISVRELTHAERKIAFAVPRAVFASHGDEDLRDDARRYIEELVEDHGADSRLLNALMTVELQGRNYDAAVRLGERAFEAAPEDPLAMQALADALFHRFTEGGGREEADFVRARELFRGQLEIEPTNPTANDHYPVTFLFDDTQPDLQALQAVAFKARYRRNPIFHGDHLENAEVLLLGGYPDEACVLVSRVSRWIRAADANLTDEERASEQADGRPSDLEHLIRVEGMLGETCRP